MTSSPPGCVPPLEACPTGVGTTFRVWSLPASQVGVQFYDAPANPTQGNPTAQQRRCIALQPRGEAADVLAASKLIDCLQNHAQIGHRALGDHLHATAGTDLFLAAKRLLFQGREWLTSAPFVYFPDHTGESGQQITVGRQRPTSLSGTGESGGSAARLRFKAAPAEQHFTYPATGAVPVTDGVGMTSFNVTKVGQDDVRLHSLASGDAFGFGAWRPHQPSSLDASSALQANALASAPRES